MTGTGQDAALNAAEKVAVDLLEALESLSTLYACAERLTQVFAPEEIATYALERLLEVIEAGAGVLYLEEEGVLRLTSNRRGACELLAADAPERLASAERDGFLHGAAAAEYLCAAGAGRSLLYARVRSTTQLLGLVVLVSEPGARFDTVALKLLTALTAQVAIALSASRHYREVILERAKLQSVLEHNGEGILVLGPNGRVSFANGVAREWLGLPADAAETPQLHEHLASWCCSVDLSRLARSELEECDLELAHGEPPSECVYAGPLRGIRDEQGQVVNLVLTLRDLTEVRREQRLKRDFLSLISHKLRTPLTIMAGTLPMVEEEDPEFALAPAERREMLGELGRQVETMAQLIGRLLCFVEVQGGSWSQDGVAAVQVSAYEAWAAICERHPDRAEECSFTVAPDAAHVAIPARRLRIVLENLLDNAIKFSAPGEARVRVITEALGEARIAIHVADGGCGIAPADQARIFEGFYQRDDEFTGSVEGMGIGLALVRAIVTQLGGSVELNSELGAGSRFTVILPAAVAVPVEASAPAR